MIQKEFEKIVKEGIKAIPKRFLEKLDNVDIVIEQEPSGSQSKKIKTGKNSLILGLYEGIPQTERECYGQVLPDKITIFKKPIEKIANSQQKNASLANQNKQNSPKTIEEITKEIVRDTVWHEIAHHLGMDEKEVRRAEKTRSLRKSLIDK